MRVGRRFEVKSKGNNSKHLTKKYHHLEHAIPNFLGINFDIYFYLHNGHTMKCILLL
jgi:hypothetical protein